MTDVLKPEEFASIVFALARVVAAAEQLLEGDSEGHVRRSIEELATTFGRREEVEPTVARMRRSILMLHETRLSGRRRAFERDKRLVENLESAIADDLIPELRRVGFTV